MSSDTEKKLVHFGSFRKIIQLLFIMRLFYGVISILSWYLPTRLYINAEKKTTINALQQLSLEILYQFSHDYTIPLTKSSSWKPKKKLYQQVFIENLQYTRRKWFCKLSQTFWSFIIVFKIDVSICQDFIAKLFVRIEAIQHDNERE